MYLLTVALLMFVLPVCSIVAEAIVFKSSTNLFMLVGKWFVFWAAGVRQLTAGIRQIGWPRFTAEGIFGIKNNEPWPIVRELGFANFSMGILGVASIAVAGLTQAAAIVSSLFFGIAGVAHLLRRKRNLAENVAMISDLFLFAVLLLYLSSTVVKT